MLTLFKKGLFKRVIEYFTYSNRSIACYVMLLKIITKIKILDRRTSLDV